MTMFLPWLLALAQSAGSPPPPPQPSPQTASPEPQSSAPTDPSRMSFPAGTSGLVLVLVKADRTADYEAVLLALRQGLRDKMLISPLMDAPRFARHFEAALIGMWQHWCDQQNEVKQS